MSVQWRIEPNFLTVPPSYKIRFMPRDSAGTEDLAAAINEENPNYSVEDAKTMLALLERVVQKKLLSGIQVTINGMLSFGLSFTGRLESPNDPMPPVNQSLHVSVRVLQPFLEEIRQQASFEKLPMQKRIPVINSAKDTRLHLPNVLYNKGVLQLTGNNLSITPEAEGNECLLAGVNRGRRVQEQFGPISNARLVFVPDIPSQNEPWQNEYILSVSSRFSVHGSPRTGIYHRRLRSVLMIDDLSGETGAGILSDSSAEAPCVTLTGGEIAADEMLQVQAVFDIRNSLLRLNLLSMTEDGPAGEAVTVQADGEYTLPGFAGSAVGSLTVNVADYAALLKLVRDQYYGRLADVLDIRGGD